jgi:Raf kinase inhibitor-like YbhB/YbcL family protein
MGTAHAGDDRLAFRKLELDAPTLEVHSSAFAPGAPLPISATIDGRGVPPPLKWDGVPAGAQSLAIVVEDPDAPMAEPFVHWLVYKIPGDATSLDGASSGRLREGRNSLMRSGFTPAGPPPRHGVHHYHFQVFALDAPIAPATGAGRTELLKAMRGHILAWGETVGTYERR